MKRIVNFETVGEPIKFHGRIVKKVKAILANKVELCSEYKLSLEFRNSKGARTFCNRFNNNGLFENKSLRKLFVDMRVLYYSSYFGEEEPEGMIYDEPITLKCGKIIRNTLWSRNTTY